MKIAYATPAAGESYVIGKKEAVRVVRALCPELPLLAFQTMHPPKTDSDIPYLVTFSASYIRVLSIKSEFVNDDLLESFLERVLPRICKSVIERRRNSYLWPSVVIIFQGAIREITCSDGWLFPNRIEIMQAIKKYPNHTLLKFPQ